MYFKNALAFFSFLLWCIPINVCSQNFSRLRILDSRQGLSENFVTSIYQDNKGLMWFGTFDGLNLFDGYSIKAFKNKPGDSLSIPPGLIREIIQDSDNRMWIVADNFAGRFDPSSRTYYPVRFDETPPTSFFEISVLSDSFLLLHGETGVHYVVHKKTMQAEQASFLDKNNEPINALNLYKTGKSGVYISYREDTVRWVAGTNRFVYAEQKKDTYTHTHTPIFKDSKERVWHLVQNGPVLGYSSLCLQDPVSKKCNDAVLKKTGRNLNFTSSILEDKYGNIWIASSKGLLVMRAASGYFEFAGDFNNNLFHSCHKIFIDNNNILWVGTKGKGIIEIDLNPVPFHNISFPVSAADSLSRDIVLGIFARGKKMGVMHDLPVDKVSIVDLKSRHIEKKKGYEMPEIKKIIAFEKNYYKYVNNNQYMHYYNWLLKNKDNFLVSRYARHLPLPQHFADKNNIPPFLQKSFDYNKHHWQGDTLWIATTSSGLRALTFHNEQKEYRYDKSTSGISGNTVMDFLFDHTGNLWIATTSGLDYFDKRSGSFTNYTTMNGLPDNAVYSLTYDKSGKIWLGTGKGLSCLDTSKKKFFNFSTRDGLLNSEYNRFSAYTANDGAIFMGGMEGIDYFNPAEITFTADILEPLIINVEVNNTPVAYIADMQLGSTQNNLHVSFTVNKIAKAGTASYAYQLAGSGDTSWQTISNSNELRFASLAPGKYTLKIKAINQHNEWSRLTEILRFTIAPNWHQATWFRLMILVIIFGVGILLARYYTEQKLHQQSIVFERKQAVALERSRISTELHDDLGSGLSTIRILSQSLNGAENNISKNPNLEKISSHSHELIQKMREIVWALNNENDTLDQLISYIRLQASTLLDNAGISYQYQIPELIPETKVTGGNRRHIHLLVKESVHNIIKHARATEVLFTVTFTDNLTIAIHDNGIGIPKSCMLTPSGNGIKNMKKHAGATQGLLAIENHIGTTIQFSVPLQSLSHESVI